MICRRCYNANTITYDYGAGTYYADTGISTNPTGVYDNYYDKTINTLTPTYFTGLTTINAKKLLSYEDWDMTQYNDNRETNWKIKEGISYPYNEYYSTDAICDWDDDFF